MNVPFWNSVPCQTTKTGGLWKKCSTAQHNRSKTINTITLLCGCTGDLILHLRAFFLINQESPLAAAVAECTDTKCRSVSQILKRHHQTQAQKVSYNRSIVINGITQTECTWQQKAELNVWEQKEWRGKGQLHNKGTTICGHHRILLERSNEWWDGCEM